MIDIVSEALRSNQIKYSRCVNRSKDFLTTGTLEQFRNDNTIRVLVMPLSLGAEGLDLIIANHIYLLEPLLNIHQESQAINRINRLGQCQQTYIHKYILIHTIEENIINIQEKQRMNHHNMMSATLKKARDDEYLSIEELQYVLDITV